jgi:hypothetical protein
MKRAWHFVGETLRDGRQVPKDGEWLIHTGDVRICESGLHASYDPFDAIEYAPAETLCLVDVDDIVTEQFDKLVCRKRRIVARMDATEMLRYFARMQAVSVLDLWGSEPPQIVLDYLMNGDDSARSAAWSAARSAARSAAWSAAVSAAWSAARSAARSAAWSAARKDFNALVNECFKDFL